MIQVPFRARQRAAAVLAHGLLAATCFGEVISWTGSAGDGLWQNAGNWDLNRVPGTAGFESDDVVIPDLAVPGVTLSFNANYTVHDLTCDETTFGISSGTLNISGSATFVDYAQSAGTLGGSGAVTVNGTLTWTGGTMGSGSFSAPDGGSTTANGELVLSGGAGRTLKGGRVFNNNDAPGGGADTGGIWSGGLITIEGSAAGQPQATFNNNQTLETTTDSNVNWGGGEPLFHNTGTLIKAAGTGASRIASRLTNTGTVLVRSGTLDLFPGQPSLTGTSSGSMAVETSGTAVLGLSGLTFTPASTITAGVGTVRFLGTSTVSGDYDVATRTDVTAGTVTFNADPLMKTTNLGATVVVSGGTLSLATGRATPHAVTDYTQTGGTLSGSDSVTVSGTLTWTAGVMSGAAVTTAAGELVLSGGAGRTLQGGRNFHNNDAPDGAESGGEWSGGHIWLVDDGTVFYNNGALVQSTNASFNWNGGNPLLANAGTFIKSGGSGTSAINVRVINSGSMVIRSGTLQLSRSSGTTPSVSSGDMLVEDSGVMLNIDSAYDFTAESSIQAPVGIVRFSGAGVKNIMGAYDVAVETQSAPCCGGIANFLSPIGPSALGATLSLSRDTINLSTGATVPFEVTTLNLSDATLGGSDSITVTGTFTWSGGTMTGTGTTTVNGELAMPTTASKILSGGRILTNNDVPGDGGPGDNGALWSDGFVEFFGVTAGQNTTFNNNGTLEQTVLNADSRMRLQSNTAQFNNSGTLVKTAGTGVLDIQLGTNNSGTIRTQSGGILLRGNLPITNTGQIVADPGTEIDLGPNFTHGPASVIGGAGTIEFRGGAHNLPVGVFQATGPIKVNSDLGGCTVTFNEDFDFPSLFSLINTGFVAGATDLTFSGGLTWTAGTFTGTGGLTVPPGAIATLSCCNDKVLERSLDNYGTINWTATRILARDVTVHNHPGATFNMPAAAYDPQAPAGTDGGMFINDGTMNINAVTNPPIASFDTGCGPLFTLINNGAINIDAGTLVIDRCVTFINRGTVDIDVGAVLRFSRPLPAQLESGGFSGAGLVRVGNAADLVLTPTSLADPTFTLNCGLESDTNVTHPAGDISVGLGRELVVGPGGSIDLSPSGDGGGCRPLSESGNWGQLSLDGKLTLIDGTVQNSNIVIRNDVTIGSCGIGSGGRITATGASSLQCCVFSSDGDRFFDMDPTEVSGPVFAGNRYDLQVTPDPGGAQPTEVGELLELRAEDMDHSIGGGESGHYELASSSGYSNLWAPQRLIVQAGARVSLTNRPGYQFNTGSPYADALYVPDIIMHPNSILNTGLQRVYYQRLLDQNGAALVPDPGQPGSYNGGTRFIRDEPLLGFSLVVIRMEDECEFDVRIRQRNRDPADVQPPAPPYHEGVIQRIDPGDGYMQMCTRDAANGSLNATSVAAHGAFAKAGEVRVLIAFKYLFESDPNAELIVYLSDSATPRDPTIPIALDPHFTQVATVRPPLGGSGAIGSGRYALFSAEFTRTNVAAAGGELIFARGTYVELELRGDDACVRIDDFDPQVRCTGNQCGDVTGNNAVAANDYLGYVAWYGRPVGLDSGGQGSTGCLDPRPMSDNYIDINDLLAADARLVSPPPADLCTGYGNDTPQNGTPVGLPADAAGFLMLGKAGVSGTQQPDLLYALDPAGAPASFANAAPLTPVAPCSLPRLGTQHRADVRLVADGGGNPHLLHLTQGLYRLDDGALLLAPDTPPPFFGDTVHIGVRTYFDANGDLQASPPLLDVTFDRTDPTVVYVAPVLIQPNGVGTGYRAAAKLGLLPGSDPPGRFTLLDVYGSNPVDDPCVNTTPPDPSACDVRAIREVEVDSHGNLFVLAARESNENDWLLVYNASNTAELRISLPALQPLLLAPTAMLLSADGSALHLAAAMNDPAATTVAVFRFAVQRSGSMVTGVTPAGSTVVSGMRHVVSLAEAPGAQPGPGRIWAFGFTGPTYTQLPYIPDTTPPLSAYATALRADFAPGDGAATAVALAAHASNAAALPLSAIYYAPPPPVTAGDTNCDGSIDFFDIDPFLLALFNPPAYVAAYPACDISSADCNLDSSVDFFDIDPFLAILFGP